MRKHKRDLNQRETGEGILFGRNYGLLTKSDLGDVAGEMLMGKSLSFSSDS